MTGIGFPLNNEFFKELQRGLKHLLKQLEISQKKLTKPANPKEYAIEISKVAKT